MADVYIRGILKEQLQRANHKLAVMANFRGYGDNITVQVIEFVKSKLEN